VDEERTPHAGKFARQVWKHYSLELDAGSNEADEWTDEEGFIEFPERTIRAGLLCRAVATGWSAMMTLAHGSTGIHAHVLVWGADTYAVEASYSPGKPLPEEIVVRR
jgi:hypothetical protein